MSKTLDSDMLIGLANETTHLTTCWRIKRRDGKEFLFTDLDRDIEFQNKTYKADMGYSKTAISSSLSLETDNLELEGFFSTGNITQEDIKIGLFDYAEVEFFLLDYKSPNTNGKISLRRGYIGEVTSKSTGRFNMELRGMLQKLNHKPGEVYSPGCRAELGDSRCKFPVFPPIRQQNCKYDVGEYIQVINPSQSVIKKQSVINGGFETDLPGSWSVLTGNVNDFPATKAHAPAFRNTHMARTPFLSITEYMSLYQDVPISLASGMTLEDIDAGNVYAYASVMAITGGEYQRDQARFRLQALDGSGAELETFYNSKFQQIKPLKKWKRLHCRASKLPKGTRTIRFFLEGRTVSGVTCEVAFDDVHLSIVKPTTTVTQAFNNDIHECTTTGVTDVSEITYSTVTGTINTDGSAVFITRKATALYSSVVTITNPRNRFSISTPLPDGWFSGGTVTFDTGANEGTAMEIKTHTAGGDIKLAFNLPYDLTVGAKLTIIPGCDKTTENCINKFRITNSKDFDTGNIRNFRGEPFLPGEEINLYPDARR